MNRKKSFIYILIPFAIIAYIAAAYNSLTFGQTNIHPDTVVASLLAREQIASKSFLPKDWCSANGELWLVNMQLYAIPLTYIIENQTLVRMLVSVINYTVCSIAFFTLSRKVFKNHMWAFLAPVYLVGLQGTLAMILWESAYVRDAVFISIMLILAFGWQQNEKLIDRNAVACLLFGCLICMQGVRNTAETLIPIAGTFVVLSLFDLLDKSKTKIEKKHSIKKTCIAVATLAGASIAAFGIYNLLCIGRSVNSNSRNGFQLIGKALELKGHASKYISNLFYLFGADLTIDTHGIVANSGWSVRTVVFAIVALLICFIIPAIQLINIRHASEATKFICAYMIAHNLLLMVAMIPFYERQEPRYCLSTVLACMFVSCNYLANTVEEFSNSSHAWKKTVAVVLVCLFAVFILYDSNIVYRMTRGWRQQRESYNVVVDELKNEGLQSGFAMWKYAYSYSIYSNFEVELYPALYETEGFEPFAIVSNKRWYEPVNEERFLLCDEDDKRIIEDNHLLDNVNANVIREFYLGDTGLYIYVLDSSDIFEYLLE